MICLGMSYLSSHKRRSRHRRRSTQFYCLCTTCCSTGHTRGPCQSTTCRRSILHRVSTFLRIQAGHHTASILDTSVRVAFRLASVDTTGNGHFVGSARDIDLCAENALLHTVVVAADEASSRRAPVGKRRAHAIAPDRNSVPAATLLG